MCHIHEIVLCIFGEENYKRLKRIVKIIGEIPMTDFLENVLNHHFENYWEEINKLLKKKDEEFRKKYM